MSVPCKSNMVSNNFKIFFYFRYFHSEPHRHSPSFDQGYHTLLNSSPTQPRAGAHHLKSANLNAGIIAHKLRAEQRNMSMSSNSTSLCSITKPSSFYTVSGSGAQHRGPLFDLLPNDVIVKIFQWMNTYELCNLATVCRRFEKLIWSPMLWKKIVLRGEPPSSIYSCVLLLKQLFKILAGDQINGDRALGNIVRRLCQDQSTCNVERVLLSEGCKITDKGLQMIARRCPNITHLQIQFSTTVSNQCLFDFVSKCTNLQHLDITGCNQITSINLTAGLETPRKLLLQYVDLTDCASINDAGLKTIVKNCPLLIYLYLRRCIQITDAGVKLLPKFCIALKELSVSDCSYVTDFGMYELAKLGATLRYLSVAKSKVSDVGLKYLARRCYKLRYLNSRGCEAISDDSITILARSCPRLRALDIGKS